MLALQNSSASLWLKFRLETWPCPHTVYDLELQQQLVQVKFLSSKAYLRDIVDGLFRDHQASLELQQGAPARDHSSSGPDAFFSQSANLSQSANAKSAATEQENMSNRLVRNSEMAPAIRKGVKPGSFIDLLVRESMKGTGESFTANQKAQQVCTPVQIRPRPLHVNYCYTRES